MKNRMNNKKEYIFVDGILDTSPLVSPIHLKNNDDCNVLYKMYCHYYRKAKNGNVYYK